MAPKRQHLALREECGICAEVIFEDDRVIAIYGNDYSYSGRTRPFFLPAINHEEAVVGGFRLCRSPSCRNSAAKPGPEFVTIHSGCYSIFAKEYHTDADALHRLWVRSAWRHPWRDAPPLHLSGQKLGFNALKRAAEKWGLPDMCRLPRELLDMIQRDSRRSLFWRHISVVQFASCVTETTPGPVISFQLSQILSWKRNEYPKDITSEEELPIIRLTIDLEGISRVERLPCVPVYSGECNNSLGSIVQLASDVSGIAVQVKDGLMRLKLPDGRSPPRIWNTLTPPDLSSFQACIPDHLSWQHIRKRSRPDCFSWQHLHAVEVEKIKGITFYFYLHAFAGIHIHYEEEPSSIDERYEKISNGRREGVWIYLPIPKNDQLLAIDIRQRHWGGIDILARTKLAGDIRIGKQQFWGPLKDLGLSEPAPQTIVYSEPVEGALVTFLGTYHEPSYQDELSKLSPFEKWGGIFDPHDHSVEPFVSWASLDDISSTLTFNDQDTGFCNGIMFHYRNGGCRTVGQCRWHVDSVIRVEHPRVFQFKAGSLQAQVVRVAFRQSEDE